MSTKAKKKIVLGCLVVLIFAGLLIWAFKMLVPPQEEESLSRFEAEVVEVKVLEDGRCRLYILLPNSTEPAQLVISRQTDFVWENGKRASINDVGQGRRIRATVENIMIYEPPTYTKCYEVMLLED